MLPFPFFFVCVPLLYLAELRPAFAWHCFAPPCLCFARLRSALPCLRCAILRLALPLPCGASWRLAMPLLLLADLCLCFAWLRSASAGAFLCYANAMPCGSQRSHCNAVLNLALAAQSCALPCRCGSALCSALASLCFAVPLPSSALPCRCGSWLSFAPLLCLAILCLCASVLFSAWPLQNASMQFFAFAGLRFATATLCSAIGSHCHSVPLLRIALLCLCWALPWSAVALLCITVPLLCLSLHIYAVPLRSLAGLGRAWPLLCSAQQCHCAAPISNAKQCLCNTLRYSAMPLVGVAMQCLCSAKLGYTVAGDRAGRVSGAALHECPPPPGKRFPPDVVLCDSPLLRRSLKTLRIIS